MVEVTQDVASLQLGSLPPLVTSTNTLPLFVVALGDKTANQRVLAELRLSGMPDASDGQFVTDRALLDARLTFYRRIGRSRVEFLLAIPYSSNPTTDNEILRVVAESTEILLLRQQLIETMRWATTDGTSFPEVFNTEGLIREMPDLDRKRYLDSLENQISENMEILAGEETIGDETQGINVTTFEPTTPPPAPGSSIWPQLR